ncbi:MAG: methionyl-tRNA formyltransferase, partial [Anaerolineae bacterium]
TEVLPPYLQGELVPHPQPVEGVTMTRPLRAGQAVLDWTASAESLHSQVRAFSPTPGAYTTWGELRVKVLKSMVAPLDFAVDVAPGTVVMARELPVVVTGAGCLVLVEVQIAGKRPMDGGAFVRGRKDFVGATLGSPQPGESST